MKESILGMGGLNIAFYRALLAEDDFCVSDPTPVKGAVFAWWGWPDGVAIELQPGDRLFSFPTPWGLQIEGVVRADNVATST